jgi:DNA mismatch repair protein MutH
VNAPESVQELLARAVDISGYSVGEIAARHGIGTPRSSGFGKGWAGNVLEVALGALAGSKQGPDFPDLGVELKSIPVGKNGKPMESTWVTTVDLLHAGALTWDTSHVHAKLACVLWVPLLTERGGPPQDRVIGSPLLWVPSAAQEAAIAADWRDLMELVVLGRAEEITARMGDVLQIRPKGQKASSRVVGIDGDGQRTALQPRGFYLRAAFTAQILARAFH